MLEHPINGLMNSAMENLKQMVDVDTIVGKPITTENGTVVIPVSKVSFGLAAGGSEFATAKETTQNPFGGGVGAGVSINPIAFLVANDTQVNLLSVDDTDAVSKIIDYMPAMVNKIASVFSKKEKTQDESENAEPIEE